VLKIRPFAKPQNVSGKLMDTLNYIKDKFSSDGFAVINSVFMDNEINAILLAVSQVDTSKPTFRKTNDLFAIRQFFKEVPACIDLIFTDKLNDIISNLFGDRYFVVKSIYFDKPEDSNWFVSYHQDLTISVDKKLDIEGFTFWTVKQNQFAVQPPLNILQDNFTIRIHLDNTSEQNGALKVVPKSHLKGVYRPETINWTNETENICTVLKGGIMFMKPLLLHASGRTTNNNKRRVIHIEFSRSSLPGNLKWAECIVRKASR
jgi:ectoine hydroxylase-related dioxygenase (phytanoyl-CoA dioxygenase family)